MRRLGVAVLAACWTLPFMLLAQVRGSGVFELNLQSFRNEKGVNVDGNCCNGYRSEGVCSATCRTFFRVCLTHYQAAIATEPNPTCTFADYTTPVVAENSVNFSVRTDLPMNNPMRFRIEEYSWPGDFSLIIEAWHDTTLTGPTTGSPRELISRLAVQRSASAGADWYNSRYATRSTELWYSYRFVCEDNYYGARCEDLCRPRDDQFGHYYCSDNGTKICKDGWQGEYCDRAICLPGCHPDNGFCDTPSECRCKLGWEGRYCNECITYPGCQHGTCTKPYRECNCQEGWGGQFCNQDLNYCTHHKPCQNGGICTNTGSGEFTCSCLAGFSGRTCETKINNCEGSPCLNAGTCEDIGTGFRCHCTQGYFGDYCEGEANYCRKETCFNGGTCVEHEDSYQCQCAQGYGGFHCETDTGRCKKDSCLNGGSCVNGICICPVGLSGPNCEDTFNDCEHNPCKNGGTCVDLPNNFQCRCVPGFVGTDCSENVNDCDMLPCANGGTCTDLVNDFSCQCANGFTGKDCSKNIDDCASNPCLHGGVCQDRVFDYKCVCPEGFWGKDCHEYQGMPTTTLPPTASPPSRWPPSSPPAPSTTTTTATTTDRMNESGNASKHDGSFAGAATSELGLTTQQLLIVVCVGGGLPLLSIIVVVVFLLCRKRRRDQRQNPMDKEIRQNIINNMNNREGNRDIKCLDGDSVGLGAGVGGKLANSRSSDLKMEAGGAAIFTTTCPQAGAGAAAAAALPCTSSSVKISNEEQEDINRLNAQQLRAAHDKAARKNFLRDSLVHEAATPVAAGHRDSQYEQYEKPGRRLHVDSLSDDNNVEISPYHRHSADIATIIKPTALADRDIVRTSLYLEPTHSRHSGYTEDYLATEV